MIASTKSMTDLRANAIDSRPTGVEATIVFSGSNETICVRSLRCFMPVDRPQAGYRRRPTAPAVATLEMFRA